MRVQQPRLMINHSDEAEPVLTTQLDLSTLESHLWEAAGILPQPAACPGPRCQHPPRRAHRQRHRRDRAHRAVARLAAHHRRRARGEAGAAEDAT